MTDIFQEENLGDSMLCCRLVCIFLLVVSGLSMSRVSWEGGSNSPSGGIVHEFTDLDVSSVFVYLTVEVYQSELLRGSM